MSDDLISRQEATQTALEFIIEYLGGAFDEDFQRKLIERMNALPSADRPQGEWIKVDDVSISCRCSVCGWEAHLYEDDVYGMPYCPNCGARMKGADDES